MPNQTFYIESNANKTQENTKQKMEGLAVQFVDASEFAHDLQKTHSVYPIDILQTQKETLSIHEILLELNT